ncbi:4-hydroxyphenylacetate 3-hydroxylase N-terminal domain-containing protein [Acanthopleuribacter pedis]|uniref:Pyoverdin chromophore biosynthetic protein pvcC n=1 Tax=Acanthopleuribacter pedis TaxID=442870 RepID=A0A8J7U606_9BACT|nr:4-hydroxyphenylacetate 3-hydroxylase N-terminal domain-containing protein [Acanthopleuribacter pedis]MBO1321028.1 hypothetical protein [Acanthopleuribacter pedis]
MILPFTGAEYLDSLNDDREVWLYGERITRVSDHPAFALSARMIARMYDSLHDPAQQETLTVPLENGGFTHRFFCPAKSAADLTAIQGAMRAWSRMSYGWMGRSLEYKGSLLSTLGVNAEFYGRFADNARRWYRRGQERMLYFNHAIVNPPVDRHLKADETEDVFLSLDRETDGGIIVSGAKAVATGSALTHVNFVGQTSPVTNPDMALSFMVPMDREGVKLICRPAYPVAAMHTGSPFDYPLSSRFDENDAVLVLDKVFIPWEDVFIFRDTTKAKEYMGKSGFVPNTCFQACTRLSVKMDFLIGILVKGLKTTGSIEFRGVRAQVGELIAWRNTLGALCDAMALNPDPWVGDTVLPNSRYAQSYRVISTEAYGRYREVARQTLASGLIYMNSSAADFHQEALRPYLDRYYRGSEGDAEARMKIMKLIWDATGSEFGGRHELYEHNYLGSHEFVRLEAFFSSMNNGYLSECEALADECMASYNLDGWCDKDLAEADRLARAVRDAGVSTHRGN